MPVGVQQISRDAYREFQKDPYNPKLHFKLVKGTVDMYSVRIGMNYRALGTMPANDEVVWSWIGSHADYTNLIP